jgi:lysozyme
MFMYGDPKLDKHRRAFQFLSDWIDKHAPQVLDDVSPIWYEQAPDTTSWQMLTSQRGIDLIKEFEGCVLEAYDDGVGVWTIGYGHTRDVRKGDRISEQIAEDLLKLDLSEFENGVSSRVKAHLNQNQFDALVSFAFNVGLGALGESTLLRVLNEGDYQGASDQFGQWVHGGGQVMDGLVRRREAEKALFLS